MEEKELTRWPHERDLCHKMLPQDEMTGQEKPLQELLKKEMSGPDGQQNENKGVSTKTITSWK